MTPTEFLRAVWPDAGPYCLAYQIRPRQEGSRSYWKHLVVDSAEEAITTAAGMSHKYDMYFAVLGLHERQKLDLKQKDPRTGEPGKIVVRTHANMRASKAQAIDVDVGEDKPYQTQAAAALALKQWVTTNQLPVPTIVSSGRGLHVYWLMDGEVSADDWRSYGEHIQALADHQGFGIDSSRSSDPSSVLRIPGTLNLKSAPLPVTTESRQSFG